MAVHDEPGVLVASWSGVLSFLYDEFVKVASRPFARTTASGFSNRQIIFRHRYGTPQEQRERHLRWVARRERSANPPLEVSFTVAPMWARDP